MGKGKHRSRLGLSSRGLTVGVAATLVLAACGGTPAPTGGPGAGGTGTSSAPAGSVYFLSTQGMPVDEAQNMRQQVLAGFNGQVTFDSSNTSTQQIQTVQAQAQAGKGTVDVLGFLHGEMSTVQKANDLEDLTPLLNQLEKTRRLSTPAPSAADGVSSPAPARDFPAPSTRTSTSSSCAGTCWHGLRSRTGRRLRRHPQ